MIYLVSSRVEFGALDMFKKGVHLLLAAVLAVTSLSPTGLQHSHHGGGVQHSSHAFVTETHRHAGQGHSHRHELPCTPELLSGVMAHTHVWLLGFEITLPPGSDSGNEDDPNDVVLIRIERQCTAPDNVWIDHGLALCPVAAVSPVASDEYLPEHAATPVDSVRLCDTARHERSGVQLI